MSECVEWIGYTMPGGYGQSNGKLAHRTAWETAHGPIPDGIEVLHSCDNPPCHNPEHLFLGTQADNMADMDAKGRRGVKEQSGHGTANRYRKYGCRCAECVGFMREYWRARHHARLCS